MGLHNVSEHGSPGRSAEFLRVAGYWLVPAVITAIALVIAVFGTAGIELLKYDRISLVWYWSGCLSADNTPRGSGSL
jgi:hypothetical protein